MVYKLPTLNTLILQCFNKAMNPEKTQLPEAVLTTNRLGFRRRGRGFTTEASETRLCQEKEVREAAWAVRCARIATIEKDAELDIGLKKAGKVLQLIDSLLRELAIRENLWGKR
jgi:outer membrane cobalamin receptor